MCRGAGSHDERCTGEPEAPSTALVPASVDIKPTSGGMSGGGPGTGGEGKGVSSIESSARAALRVLGLDDTWPTELTLREIRRRYMREALLCHPDKGTPSERD